MAVRIVRIFVSSPGDVDVERRRVDRVIARLNGEFSNVVQFEAIRWETKFYTADSSFQPQIPQSIDCDVVIGLFWSRLGSELPPGFPLDEDGKPFPSGTAYEILTAIRKRQAGGELPDVYIFRKTAPVPLSSADQQARNRALIQMDLLEGFWRYWFRTETGHFKAAFQSFETPDGFEEQMEDLLRQWVSEHVPVARSVRWPIALKGSPFRGLQPFDVDHASVFFGRERETRRGVDLLLRSAEAGTPALFLVGASGSGKSSLVRAGLVPRLQVPGVVAGVDIFRLCIFRPSEHGDAIHSLAQALFGVGALPELAEGDHQTPAAIEAMLRHGDRSSPVPLLSALDRIAAVVRGRDGFDRPVRIDLILVIDQLEEVFAEGEAHETFGRLLQALAATGRIWIVTTMRADFYDRLLASDSLKVLKEKAATFDLALPGKAELAEIVRGPAEAAGLIFERDPESGQSLDDRILQDATPDVLPLVQFTLQRLFEEREIRHEPGAPLEAEPQAVTLTLGTYAKLGGLDGAVDTEAERAVGALGKAECDALPKLLRHLSMIGGTADRDNARLRHSSSDITARPARLEDVTASAAARRLVEALVASRILLLEESRQAYTIVRLAHERVLTAWGRAAEIMQRSRDFLRRRSDVERQERRWRESGRLDDFLIPAGLALAEASALLDQRDELDPDLIEFVETSEAADDRKRLAALARTRRLQRLSASVAAVFAVIAGLALFFWWQADQAQTVADLARKQADLSAEQARNGAIRANSEARRAGEEARRAEVAALRADDEAQRATEAARIAREREAEASEARAAAVRSKAEAEAQLVETKRNYALALLTQSDLLLSQGDVAAALTNSLKVAELEKADGAESSVATTSSLMRAVAAQGMVFHVEQPISLTDLGPFDFTGPSTVVYSTPGNQLVTVDLKNKTMVAKTPSPLVSPNFIGAINSACRLVVANSSAVKVLPLCGQQGDFPALPFDGKIVGVQVSGTIGHFAVATENTIGFIDAAAGELEGDVELFPKTSNLFIRRIAMSRDGQTVHALVGDRTSDKKALDYVVVYDEGWLKPTPVPAEVLRADRLVSFGNANDLFMFTDVFGGSPRMLGKKGKLSPAFDGKFENANFVGYNAGVEATERGTDEPVFLTTSGEKDQNVVLSISTDYGDGPTHFTDLRFRSGAFQSFQIQECKVSGTAGYVVCHYINPRVSGLVAFALTQSSTGRVVESYSNSAVVTPDHTVFAGGPSGLRKLAGDAFETVDQPDVPSTFALRAIWKDCLIAERYDDALAVYSLRPTCAGTTASGLFGGIDQATGMMLVRRPDTLQGIDLATGILRWKLDTPGGQVLYSAAGIRRAVFATRQTLYFVDAQTGKTEGSYRINADNATPWALDAQGRHLAYQDPTRVVRMLDLESGQELDLPKISSLATTMSWSPDGETLYVGGYEGTVGAWNIRSGTIWSNASHRGNAPLTLPTGDLSLGNSEIGVRELAVSANGKFLAVLRHEADTQKVSIISAATGLWAMDIVQPRPYQRPVHVEMDQNQIVTVWDNAVTVDSWPDQDELITQGRRALSILDSANDPEAPYHEGISN
ncbi:AAA family ATPase (plasmid) [Agrobacterium vitis]|uniref:nSTAND1 domain-containing NTPase n=1 Tax=Agrobacterium vitis TaxID=373 RepID=UPI003D2B932A